MPFKILFKGLVCHVTDERGETAVFISGPPVPRHELRLIVPKAEHIISAQCPQDPASAPEGGRAFIIEKKVLSITGVLPTAARKSAKFERNVPALRHLTAGGCTQLAPAVTQRRVTSQLKGYLNHPSGRFDVVTLFRNKGRFTHGNIGERCVASLVSLSLASTSSPVTISGRGVKLVLRPDATIRIHNVVFGAVGLMNDHFFHYGAVLSNKCKLQGTILEVNDPCSGPEFAFPEFPTVECSNTNVP